MKTKYTLLILFLCFVFQPILAQTAKKAKVYFIKIDLLNGKKVKGKLVRLDDSFIEVEEKSETQETDEESKIDTFKIPVEEIRMISIRPKKALGRGYILGVLVGSVIGTLVVAESANSYEEVVLGSYAGAAIGFAAGGLLASGISTRYYQINGATPALIRAKKSFYQNKK